MHVSPRAKKCILPQIPNRFGLSGTPCISSHEIRKKALSGPSLGMDNDPFPMVNGKFEFEFGFLFLLRISLIPKNLII
jgi:hypothetical protein